MSEPSLTSLEWQSKKESRVLRLKARETSTIERNTSTRITTDITMLMRESELRNCLNNKKELRSKKKNKSTRPLKNTLLIRRILLISKRKPGNLRKSRKLTSKRSKSSMTKSIPFKPNSWPKTFTTPT